MVWDIDWQGLNKQELAHLIDQNPFIVKIKQETDNIIN